MATQVVDGVIPSGRWLRGDVHIEGDELVLDEDTVALYDPASEPSLLWDFVAIETDADALDYARRYGLLRRTPPNVLREPLFSWHAEAELLRGTLGLYADLAAALDRGSDALLELRTRWAGTAAEGVEPPSDDALVGEVRGAICASVNRGLDGTQVRLAAAQSGFLLEPSSPTLFGLLHFRLARIVHGDGQVRRCLECDGLFAPRDGRQRFCSERHASRARLKRHRSRARLQTGSSATV